MRKAWHVSELAIRRNVDVAISRTRAGLTLPMEPGLQADAKVV